MKAKFIKESLSEGRYDKWDETPRFTQQGPNYKPDFRNSIRSTAEIERERLEREKKIKEPKIKSPRVPSLWNRRKYDKWVKEMSWREETGDDEDYNDFAYEMAQNAQYEPGLVDYISNVIKREGGDEDPLERIQWDIERNM